VLVLSKLFRRLMLERLAAAHDAGKLTFFGAHAHLADKKAFAKFLKSIKATRWFVYAKRPFAGPKAVLAYLSRYTHRVAISNRRLIAADTRTVTFKVKDCRIEGPGRYTTMTLATGEFIRRLLMHVLPKGLHRIRHYGVPLLRCPHDHHRNLRACRATGRRQSRSGSIRHEERARRRPECPLSRSLVLDRQRDRSSRSLSQAGRIAAPEATVPASC